MLLVAYAAYILHMVVVYSLTVKAMGGLSPIQFFKGMLPAILFAFSSASSVGTLPLNLECVQKLGAKKDVASLNAKLHESKAYNIFQTGVTATAVFTGGMTTTMKCFVAGTLVLTASGLIAIEQIKVGDIVYAADEESLDVSLKPVLETYIRETSSLIHITVNGEEIISTYDHPYYVNKKGFVSAELLWIGAELVDKNGKVFQVEQIYREKLDDESEKVYNFKVEECHTYFVGSLAILVHNANYPDHMTADGKLKPNTEYSAGEHDYTYKTDSLMNYN